MTDQRPPTRQPRTITDAVLEPTGTPAARPMPRAVFRTWVALLAALDERPPLDVAVALGDAITVLLGIEHNYALPGPAAMHAEVHAAVENSAPLATLPWQALTTAAFSHLESAIDEAADVQDLARYGATAALVRRALEQARTATAPGVDAP